MTGFSPTGMSIAHIPGLSLDASALPRHWDVSASVRADARSLLLAVGSGVHVLHWVEVDHSDDRAVPPPNPFPRATLMWPAGRLNDSTRYIVAYRNIVDDAGAPVAAPPGFAALRDGTPSSSPDVEASRPRYEAIFAALAAAGWARASLTLAWDFTTATKADTTGRLVAMRDDALRRATYAYTITAVADNPRRGIARQVQGTFETPVYLNTLDPVRSSRLVLDSRGLPVCQGVARFNFTVVIPHSVANGTFADGGFVQYGHGLFGGQGEVQDDYLGDFADEYGYVLAAVDEVGLAAADAPVAFYLLSANVSDFGCEERADACHRAAARARGLPRVFLCSEVMAPRSPCPCERLSPRPTLVTPLHRAASMRPRLPCVPPPAHPTPSPRSVTSLHADVPDRCHQGLLNELLATRLVTQSAFRTDPAMTFRGTPAVSADPARWHYYGNSQGEFDECSSSGALQWVA